MPTSEYEPVPSEMSPVKRYYNDIRYKSDSYVDLRIAAEKLLEQEGVTSPDQSYDQLYGLVLPDSDTYHASPEAAVESFMTFPLEIVAPYLEMTLEPSDLQEWHTRTARQIMDLTEVTHRDTCYTLSFAESTMCKVSSACPRRALTAFLQKPVRDRDFTGLEYMVDPDKKKQISLNRLEIAKKLKIISDSEYLATGASYRIAYAAHFGTRA